MKNNFSELAKSYKRNISNSFFLVDGNHIKEVIQENDLCVTRKIDGTMQMLFYRDGEAVAVSTSGKELRGLPCLDEFAALVERDSLKSVTVVAELYAALGDTGRERVFDVSRAIADKSLNDRLKLAIFDIVDIDDESCNNLPYPEKIDKIKNLFTGERVHAVEAKAAATVDELEQIYNLWVIKEGAEGVVVRTGHFFSYKIKPHHPVDAVIVGYTTKDAPHCDSVRDIMVAVMTPAGLLQQFAVTGTGFTSKQRQELFALLSPLATQSNYIETDSRNIAFQMVKPKVIVELLAGDYLVEDSLGKAKMNTLLRYTEEDGYTAEALTPGVSAHHLSFVGIREDKELCQESIRISQITDICPFSTQEAITYKDLPKSDILLRRVFTKGIGEKMMVQKFVVWKTNKEQSGRFPAYVFHYTDFSAGRKEPLKRDIRVSSNKNQIMAIAEEFIVSGVKKGWVEVA